MKTAKLSDWVAQQGQLPATSDADLINRFLADRDEPAFALIVRRHGPQVLGVCQRVTGDRHLADDAFQAVFVVLAAKAGSVRPRSALPAWLYGVAYRIALRARTMRDRRRRHEKTVETLPEPAIEAVDEVESSELVAALDEEIARLPEPQRVAVVVCELEGQSRQEAAARLGISDGTLSSRLARARRALADRLRRRGIALSSAGLVAAFAQLAPARVSDRLASSAVACAIGPGLVPTPVAALSTGALRTMFLQRLTALVIASGLLASALFAVERFTAANPPAPPDVTEPISLAPAPAHPAEPPLPKGQNELLFFRDGHLVLVDPDGKNEKKVTPERLMYFRDVRLAPNGKTVAYLVSAGLRAGQRVPVEHQTKLHIRGIDETGAGTDLNAQCKEFVWSADGSEIACTEFAERPDDQFVGKKHFVVDVKTKEKSPLKIPDDHYLNDWSRDGKYFLTMRIADTRPRLVRLYLMKRDGSEAKALTDEDRYCTDGRLSPDGKRVLHRVITVSKPDKSKKGEKEAGGAEEVNQELVVLDIQTGKSLAVKLPPECELIGYCWSPDGKRIAYTWKERHHGKPEELAKKETKSRLVVCDPDGKNAKTIATEKGGDPWVVTIGRVDWR